MLSTGVFDKSLILYSSSTTWVFDGDVQESKTDPDGWGANVASSSVDVDDWSVEEDGSAVNVKIPTVTADVNSLYHFCWCELPDEEFSVINFFFNLIWIFVHS